MPRKPLSEIQFDEHDDVNNAKRVNLVAGDISVTSQITVVPLQAWPDPKTYIGLVTITGSLAAAAGNVTLDAGSLTGIIGNVTIDQVDVVTAVTNITNPVALKGNLTIDSGNISVVGNVTVEQGDNPWVTSNVGNVTVEQGDDPWNVAVVGNVTLSDPKTFIGLTTSESLNAGTTKDLIPKNFSFAQASITTIAVPTATFNITSLIANSNATVGIRILSGATYLVGNVSLSVMLNPGGGWVQHGSPDSPIYNGLADASAIVIEKEDLGVVAEIAGHLMYYEE